MYVCAGPAIKILVIIEHVCLHWSCHINPSYNRTSTYVCTGPANFFCEKHLVKFHPKQGNSHRYVIGTILQGSTYKNTRRNTKQGEDPPEKYPLFQHVSSMYKV
jgi:hypothetical protein